MKRVILQDDIFGMSKLTKKRASKVLVGEIGEFIYFSAADGGHGPRIKFYGGTKETSTTRNAPSLGFGKDGCTELFIPPHMDNRISCPNAYDANYLDHIKQFVNKFLSILLLVWFGKLDESDALAYFEGRDDFSTLKSEISTGDDTIDEAISQCSSLDAIHELCIEHNVYTF